MNQDILNMDSTEQCNIKHLDFKLTKCCDCKSEFASVADVSNCLFCGSTNLIANSNLDTSKKFIIPFKKSMSDAIKDYKKNIGFNPLIPGVFKKDINNKMNKVYVMCELSNLKVSGETTFLGVDKNNLDMRYEVVNTVNFDFLNILGNSSLMIDDQVFYDICNYDYKNLGEFNFSSVDKDVILMNKTQDSESIKKEVLKTALGMIKDNVKHEDKKLKDNRLSVSVISKKEVFVPVYCLKINYNNKDYMYVMNGEDGRSNFSACWGKRQLILFSVGLLVFIFAVSLLAVYFL